MAPGPEKNKQNGGTPSLRLQHAIGVVVQTAGDGTSNGISERRTGGGLAGVSGRGTTALSEITKKEEFPGTMRNMPAGNSFPQICVVSENYFVETRVT